MKKIIIIFLVLSGCGSSYGPPPAPEAPKQAAEGGGAPAAEQAGAQTSAQVSSKWLVIRKSFESYTKKPLQGKRDVFISYLADFSGIDEIIDELVSKEQEKQEQTPKSPLEIYPPENYVIDLIQSGTADPKAMITDPSGKAYIVGVGTKIGNRGGKIQTITQYQVIISDGDHPPITKEIEQPEQFVYKELENMSEF
jgi:hypothetical protein